MLLVLSDMISLSCTITPPVICMYNAVEYGSLFIFYTKVYTKVYTKIDDLVN